MGQAELVEASPESVGFCSRRLERLHGAMSALVENKTFPGLVTLLGRHGKVVDVRAHGTQALDSAVPMGADTIVRIASMTKPVTGVAMMILYEEGKWRPDEPLSLHIPEFAGLQVLAGLDADGRPQLAPPRHPPTMGELMSHSAGFSYGFNPAGNVIDKLYAEAPLFSRFATQAPVMPSSLQDMIDKLAAIPLLYQPGARWVYSVSVDIQGYLVEKLSGQPFQTFLRERIFEPLGMADTAFHVPAEKQARLAGAYMGDEQGTLTPVPPPPGLTQDPAFVSGGGGLFSTARDYARFAEMLAGRGRLDDVRILAPSSVRLMATNHLDPRLLENGEFGLSGWPNGYVFPDTMKTTDAFGVALYRARPGVGFGYDVSVIFDPERAGRNVGPGTFHWDGAFGTWFWVDPTHEVFFVGVVQRMDLRNIPNLQEMARALVYQALVEPEA
jgi:CubicO group peptidase (beta-lactamase class C family)